MDPHQALEDAIPGPSGQSNWVSSTVAPIMDMPLYGGGFWVACMQLVAYYYACAAVLHFALPRLISVKGIQAQKRKHGEVLRDAVYSIGPIAVKACVWVCVEYIHKHKLGFTYEGKVQGVAAVLYMLACIVVLDYLHDAWFYWTHRMLHWGPLYRHVHYIHHKSRAPSAFTGYSFHIVEAAIVFANEVLVTLLFPLHMGLHRWYHLITTIIHEAGHAGYELSPFIPTIEGMVALIKCGLSGSSALNTVQHHDLHHRFPTKHFSLYFTHWDRLCGTLHPRYDEDVFSYFPKSDGSSSSSGGVFMPKDMAATAADAGADATDKDLASGAAVDVSEGRGSGSGNGNGSANVSPASSVIVEAIATSISRPIRRRA